ncbi:MAG: hypothetical protein QW770_05145, partial [Candidatus Bathyarchaeia archaeon]
LYVALRQLAIEAKKGESARIPYFALREFLLELLPHFLGSKAGCDFDGLPLDDLLPLIQKMSQDLPETCCKEEIMQYLGVTRVLAEHTSFPEEQDEDKHVALVIIPPEDVTDPDGSERRSIKQLLESCSNKTPIYIATRLLARGYTKDNVDSVLNIFGSKYLGLKTGQVKDLFEKMLIAYQISENLRELELFSAEEQAKILSEIREIVNKYGKKTIITLLPYTPSRMNWIVINE